jgi:uncharacterized membrane protein
MLAEDGGIMSEGESSADGRQFVTPEHGRMATTVYILYLVGLAIGITALVGLIIAYTYRDGAPHWVRTHYHFQIRTFWIGVSFVLVGAVTSFIVIGWFVLLFWLVWLVVRCVKGLKLLGEGQAHPNPLSWGF